MLLSILVLSILLIVFAYNSKKCFLLTIVLYPTLYLFSINNFNVLSVLALFFVFYVLRHRKKKRNFPFGLASILCISSYLISSFGRDEPPHMTILTSYLIDYIFIYVFWSCFELTKNDQRFLCNVFVLYLAVNSILAMFEAISGFNPFIQFLHMNGTMEVMQGSDYVRNGFHRAQGMAIYNDPFGLYLVISLVVIINYYYKGFFNSTMKFFVLIGFVVFAIFLTGSRSVIACMVIALLSASSFVLRNKKMFFGLFFLIIFICVFASSFLSSIIDGFINIDDTGGSSTSMRELQWMTTLSVWKDAPIFGHGLGYIYNIIKASIGLAGGESIVFYSLIDRGIWGLFTIVFLWLSVAVWLYKTSNIRYLFLLLAFAICKIITLAFGLNEAFVIIYLLVIIKIPNLKYTK